MFGQTPLRCSFCGRGEDEVAKLVAGAKAYICDECVASATEILRESTEGVVKPGKTTPEPEGAA